jgi:hypothetical protein
LKTFDCTSINHATRSPAKYARWISYIFGEKTGADEGIRILDPNLGKIRLYEISVLNQLFIKLVKNPNTIRTFLKAVRLECFVLNVLVAALRPVVAVSRPARDP